MPRAADATDPMPTDPATAPHDGTQASGAGAAHGHTGCAHGTGAQGRHDHSHGHSHGHHHALPPEGLDRAMAIGVGLNAAFVAVEIAAGVAGGSLALVADAGHNAGDVLGLLLAWGAARLARRPPTRRYTWGLRRSTIWAALANAVLLFVACGGILQEAFHRWWRPVPVAGPTMIAVAAVGVAINALTALLFMRGAGADANVRGAFLHMLADAAVSAGVVLAGIAVTLTGWAWIDPLVGIAVTIAILVGTWDLFREGMEMGLDAVPRSIDPLAVEAALGGLAGVSEVHDLHIWSASTSEATLTAHLVVADDAPHAGILAAAVECIRDRFGIAHSTIQLELATAAEQCPQRPADTL